MIPIYVLRRTPGATIVTEWTDICRSKTPFITIQHDNLRNTSRWQAVERKRKFSVTLFRPALRFSRPAYERWYPTLDKAMSAAERIAKEECQ